VHLLTCKAFSEPGKCCSLSERALPGLVLYKRRNEGERACSERQGAPACCVFYLFPQ
jgi:hypothetical protein